MTESISLKDLKRIHQIMEAMLEQANQENWHELMRLDGERRVVLNYTADVPEAGTPNRSGNKQIDTGSIGTTTRPFSAEHQILGKQLAELDQAINKKLNESRQSLVEQTRGLRAQVSAKKNYERVNSAQVSTYG